MTRREQGQVTVAGVGIALLVVAATLVFVHLAVIRAQGGHGQTAADVAALAGARVLADNPAASEADVRSAAVHAAEHNGARLVRFQVDRTSGIATAVDVVVLESAGGDVPGAGRRDDSVRLVSRAGVKYRDPPLPGSPAAVDLRGFVGANAVVRAAMAQIGWPYVWGAESRAEGGFDCSGLVDYAYAAAGHPLPGRPTSESLWSMAQHITAEQLQPGDLVFLGAASGAPYHVGLYAGGGLTVVAPHTGANVELEPLNAVRWDGFGRLIGGVAPGGPVSDPVVAAARRYNVPPTVLQAALGLGVVDDPAVLAQRLAAAMQRSHGNIADALTAVLGSKSLAGAVFASLSSASSNAAAGGVELLPRMQIQWRKPEHGFSWSNLANFAGAVSDYGEELSRVRDENRGRAVGEEPERVGLAEHGTGVAALTLAGSNFLPIGTAGHVAAQLANSGLAVAGELRHVLSDTKEAASAGKLSMLFKGAGRGLGVLGVALYCFGAVTASRWGGPNGRWINILGAAASVALLCSTAFPPVALAGAIVLAAIAIYQNWDTISRWGRELWDGYTRPLGDDLRTARWGARTVMHVGSRVASTVGGAVTSAVSVGSSCVHKVASFVGL